MDTNSLFLRQFSRAWIVVAALLVPSETLASNCARNLDDVVHVIEAADGHGIHTFHSADVGADEPGSGHEFSFETVHGSRSTTGPVNVIRALQVAEVSVQLAMPCTVDGSMIRFDIGITRDIGRADVARFARLVAVAPFAYGSWHAGASHGDSRERSYYGGAVVQTDLRPVAIEARWQNREGIWQTLVSAGVQLFNTETMQLALGFVQLDDRDDMQRRLMLKFSGEF